MLLLNQARLLVGVVLLAVGLLVFPATAQGQKKIEPVKREIPTYDGVRLTGWLYSNPTKEKKATVLMLHGLDLKKGTGSEVPGWSDLASSLAAEGHTVLAIDFRGFGESKSVDKEKFWNFTHNGPTHLKKNRNKATLEGKDLPPSYLQNLVYDVAAAKAYLDERSDASVLNASNLFVIGAGEGATVGAMFVADECRRRQFTRDDLTGAASFGELEVNNVAGCVWISINGSIGSKTAHLTKWLYEAGHTHKVPMVFVYAKSDTPGAERATMLLNKIKPNKDKDLEFTGRQVVANAKLSGISLLDKNLDTSKNILTYVRDVMKERTNKDWKKRAEKVQYAYTPAKGPPVALRVVKAGEVDVPALFAR